MDPGLAVSPDSMVREPREAVWSVQDSRQRWRDFAALAADLAFETDAAGRLTFVWPDPALGWPADELIGQHASVLLASPCHGPHPFHAVSDLRRVHVWLRTAGGAARLHAVSLARQACGALRGVATDIGGEDAAAGALARSARRTATVDDIIHAMRGELHMPRMVGAVLDGATRALGAAGSAIVTGGRSLFAASHATVPIPESVLGVTGRMLLMERPVATVGTFAVMTCAVPARLGDHTGLVFWREPALRPWDADERAVACSLTSVLRVVLEQDRVQHEMARQARTDPLTGLLNRRAFARELTRRVQRMTDPLDTGVLIYLDLDCFKRLNDTLGHEAGDTALLATVVELRRVFRPTDLLARLGGDEFAVWLDGADEMTAAERAEDLRRCVPGAIAAALPESAPGVTVSLGIARRGGGDPEDIDALIRRADTAMYVAKRTGRDQWHVTPAPP